MRLRRLGSQDHELLRHVELPQRRGGRSPQHREGVSGRAGALGCRGPLVSPVSGCFHQTQIPYVARQRRLRDLDPLGQQALPELFLAGNGLPIDEFEYQGLPV